MNQLLEFLAASPNDSFILFAIAKEYEKYNHREKALNYYLKLKEVDANYVGLYYHLGKLYERMEAYEKALIAYKEGIHSKQSAAVRGLDMTFPELGIEAFEQPDLLISQLDRALSGVLLKAHQAFVFGQ